MPELRWTLIFIGLALVVGLWLWESRRQRQQAEEDEAGPEVEKAQEPLAATHSGVEEDSAAPEPGLPPIRASRRERGAFPRNPPVVEIPGGVEPQLARPARDDESLPPVVQYGNMQDEPLARGMLQAADGDAEDTGDASDARPDTAAAVPQAEQDAGARQQIVALRLIAERGRWPGRTVVEALQAEGLTYGKYSIFHRERDDGKSIFFVASMVEPGSFDLDGIDAQSFPGISVFAVIPGPLDAPTTFDLMLATARRLAERLSGHLQDEQGSTLTAQRVLNLREELVHQEHVARRVQRR